MVCKHLTHLRELEKENAILKYHLATISYFVNLDNLGIKAIEHKAGQVIINLDHRQRENDPKPEKPKEKVGLHGIDVVMGGVMEAQKRHVERMKPKEEKEKIEETKPVEQQNFKQFAAGMNKVECVECKEKISLADCSYDPARNKHTCHSCVKKLKEAEEKKKEAETQEKIKELEGGIK